MLRVGDTSRPDRVALVEAALAERRGATARRPFVLGIAGAQGSGKSTLAAALARRLEGQGLRAAVLSLDDLYLDRAARAALAARVHPLLATRGVPGTHDVAAGLALIDALGRGEPVLLPRFDKARDEPFADHRGQPLAAADVLVLEGWCLGARPQAEANLAEPVNALEREHDPDGTWRRWINARLADYQPLFARIDLLVLLAAPGFDAVAGWRIEQEHALRGTCLERGEPVDGVMSDAQVRSFVAHYQRLTEHLLREGPGYADLTIRLDAARRVVGVESAG